MQIRSRDTGARLDEVLRSLKQSLFPYQTQGVQRFLQTGRLLLADDMGLGKTAQAIAACHALYAAGALTRGLIIAPASLKAQWLREWQLFSDYPIKIVQGPASARADCYRSTTSGFLIANYEQVLRDLQLMHDWNPGIMVLDEAQRIKNASSKTANFIKKLEPPYRLILTGTPMENRMDELASLMEWIDLFAIQPAWRLFPWYSAFSDGNREVTGARNLDTLRTRLSPFVLRRRRAEVLQQLPTRRDICVPVPMTHRQFVVHDALLKPIRQLLAIAKERPLTEEQFLKLMSLLEQQRIVSNGFELRNFEQSWPELSRVSPAETSDVEKLSSPKLLKLREIVEEVALTQGRKIVVFSQWVRMLQLAHWAIEGLLARHRKRAVYFTGRESLKRRTQNIVEFHDDPSVAVFLASDAGGLGLNLQRAATCCVNLELPWNPAVLEQRIGRIYRLGQKHPVDVFNIVSEMGIEEHIGEVIKGKKALFFGLFDGTSDEIHFEERASFMNRMEKLVEPVVVPRLAKKPG